MKKTIGIAGNILVDAVKKIECWPQRGMLVNINGVSHAIGGCVGNTAVDLKRLDEEMDVCVFGRIGKDEYGDSYKGSLSLTLSQQNAVSVDDPDLTDTVSKAKDNNELDLS